MKLEGSCHCGAVRYTVDSETPYPYMYCYCSICRKTTGFVTCNVMGKRETLAVEGEERLRCYNAVLPAPPEHVHLMLTYKPGWAPVPGDGPRFDEYPELSIADWHDRHGLRVP